MTRQFPSKTPMHTDNFAASQFVFAKFGRVMARIVSLLRIQRGIAFATFDKPPCCAIASAQRGNALYSSARAAGLEARLSTAGMRARNVQLQMPTIHASCQKGPTSCTQRQF